MYSILYNLHDETYLSSWKLNYMNCSKYLIIVSFHFLLKLEKPKFPINLHNDDQNL